MAIKPSVSIGDALRFHSFNKMAGTSFWTRERIARAVPKTKLKESLSSAGARGIEASVTVSNTDRKKPPYQSVGILMFTVKGQEYHGTAFATSITGANNVIFTAAHNLVDKDGDSENILFIPAIQNNLCRSKPYGKFEQIDGKKGTAFFVHPKYDVGTEPDAYDLGSVKLKKNAGGKELGEVVGLLNIVVDKSYTTSDSFTAIGFPETNVMQKNTGDYKGSEDKGEVISKYGNILSGSSGGPWLFNGNDVNGSKASRVLGVDSSPYFSKDKISAIVSQM